MRKAQYERATSLMKEIEQAESTIATLKDFCVAKSLSIEGKDMFDNAVRYTSYCSDQIWRVIEMELEAVKQSLSDKMEEFENL